VANIRQKKKGKRYEAKRMGGKWTTGVGGKGAHARIREENEGNVENLW